MFNISLELIWLETTIGYFIYLNKMMFKQNAMLTEEVVSWKDYRI